MDKKYLNKELNFLKVKRKVEILVTCLNQNKKISMKDIEASIEAEFKNWTNKILNMQNQIQESLNIEWHKLDANNYKNLQELYRNLVRKLHPDLNKNLTDKQKLLWNRVQSAYQRLDYEEMKALEVLVNSEEDVKEESSMDQLNSQKQTLWNKVQELLENIKKLKQQFPFDIEMKLNDPSWIIQEIESYQSKIDQINSAYKEYEFIYKDLTFQLYGTLEEHPENL